MEVLKTMNKRIVVISTEKIKAHAIRARRNKSICEALFKKDPHCYYCHVELKWYPEIRNFKMKRNSPIPRDMATLEHLYDRFDIRRYDDYPNNEDKVLACWLCNNKRSNINQKFLSEEEVLLKKEQLKKRKGKHWTEPLETIVID